MKACKRIFRGSWNDSFIRMRVFVNEVLAAWPRGEVIIRLLKDPDKLTVEQVAGQFNPWKERLQEVAGNLQVEFIETGKGHEIEIRRVARKAVSRV